MVNSNSEEVYYRAWAVSGKEVNGLRRSVLENNKVTSSYRMERIDNIADHVFG